MFHAISIINAVILISLVTAVLTDDPTLAFWLIGIDMLLYRLGY